MGELEDDYSEFYHSVNVSESEKRFTLDTQLNDYMSYMLNKYSGKYEYNNLINNINNEINRFKELRQIYSAFDSNNNPQLLPENDEYNKPLKELLVNLNKKLYWI